VWDAVFWTAGSSSADPVPEGITGVAITDSGRLTIDETLRCTWSTNDNANGPSITSKSPTVWALGDCAEIIPSPRPGVPRTAQAAIQQADVVASNVLSCLTVKGSSKKFKFQDLGTVLNLGGPNGAVLGPNEQSQLEPLLVPLLDTARIGLSIADTIFSSVVSSPAVDEKSAEVLEKLGLSLGGYGLGVDPQTTPGTISGTLSGISR
jgi:hypothetical protein